MTLTKLYDHLDLNLIERWKKRDLLKELKNVYYSDDLDDVYKILDYTNNNLLFDRKCCSNKNFQAYYVLLNDSIKIWETKKDFISNIEFPLRNQINSNISSQFIRPPNTFNSFHRFNVQRLNSSFLHKFFMTEKDYEKVKCKLEKRGIKYSGENIFLATNVYSSLFFVNSLYRLPKLEGLDIFIPPRIKRREKYLEQLINGISIPELQLEPIKV